MYVLQALDVGSLLTSAQAGLTTEERDLIAAAYDEGTLLVCVATCSLAAGINL
jgi:replicative superfamily II helicase